MGALGPAPTGWEMVVLLLLLPLLLLVLLPGLGSGSRTCAGGVGGCLLSWPSVLLILAQAWKR